LLYSLYTPTKPVIYYKVFNLIYKDFTFQAKYTILKESNYLKRSLNMNNKPTRGKLLAFYNAVGRDHPVSREDLEKLVDELKKKYPDRLFNHHDVGNLLYQGRGFMIPHPEREGYFLRSDSSLASGLGSNSVSPVQSLDLDMMNSKNFSRKLEDITKQHEELRQHINEKVEQKERLEQELWQDQEKLKELEDTLELAREFFRKAA